MSNCGNCKHWEKRAQYEAGHNLGLGKCRAALQLFDATEWSEDEADDADYFVGRVIKPEFRGRRFFVQDASDYRADLLTLPTFSCIEHEPAGRSER